MPPSTSQKLVASSKKASLKFMPMIPARTTAGSRTADSKVRVRMTSFARCETRPMWMSNVPSSPSRKPLDGRHRRLEPVDQAGPRLADGVLDAEPGQRQGRERIAMRCERPADEADPPPERDDRREDVVAVRPWSARWSSSSISRSMSSTSRK